MWPVVQINLHAVFSIVYEPEAAFDGRPDLSGLLSHVPMFVSSQTVHKSRKNILDQTSVYELVPVSINHRNRGAKHTCRHVCEWRLN